MTRGARVPTIVTGRVTTLAQAEAILADGDRGPRLDGARDDRRPGARREVIRRSTRRRCGRASGATRAASGGSSTLRPGGGRTGCSVNPDVGREGEPPPAPAAAPRRVLVVGAGPAGLEAAWTAARRGHEVSIREAAEAPGGLLRVQRRAPHRAEIGRISDWLWDELGRLRVERRLGSRVDAELARGFDAVVVATGSLPRRDGVQRLRPAQEVEGIERAVTPRRGARGRVPVAADGARLRRLRQLRGGRRRRAPARGGSRGVPRDELRRGGTRPLPLVPARRARGAARCPSRLPRR